MISEFEDYWINNDEKKFIFKQHFNKPITAYIDLISVYNELIFANYDNYDIFLETNNDLNFDNFYLIIKKSLTYTDIKSLFDQPINNMPQNLKVLNFGYSFNQPINNIPQNLKQLSFDYIFNQSPILSASLTHLVLGCEFNKQLILPANLTHLVLGFKFNQPLTLPTDLTHLTIDYYFSYYTDLPNIKYFKIDNDKDLFIDFLPDSLEELVLGNNFESALNNLPNSIKK